MADFETLDSGLASEFVKYLNSQLKETRNQLQRSVEANAALLEELQVHRTSLETTGSRDSDAEPQDITVLHAEIATLRQELDDARCLAATRQAESDAWRTRYEQLKPQLSGAAAQAAQLLDTMRQQLDGMMCIDSTETHTRTGTQFRVFLSELPRIASSPTSPTVIWKGKNLPPIMSKAITSACIGGFCFFGDLLRWCPAPSHHAYVVLPEYQYVSRSHEGGASWTQVTNSPWTTLAGQQRELFYFDGDNICYSGTFFCHAGPKSIKVLTLGDDADEALLKALSQKTFHADTKSQKTKAKTHVPLLAELYKEGAAPVQIVGLQRVGFNEKLCGILSAKGARNKRFRDTAILAEMLGVDTEGTAQLSTQKRAIAHVNGGELDALGDFEARSGPGPLKVPRLDESDGMEELSGYM
ncbi:hypothetical protein C8Q80DRAFT_1267870 [Daedaleopsis nitida]|nr:hypothetical protein C8Q80DRAFT_1267870 [Daedaleopsis nitida]